MSDWIEIKEGCEMPQLGRAAIVLVNGKTEAAFYRWPSPGRKSRWMGFNNLVLREGVTHWMPLPAPPEPEAPHE